MFPFTDTAPRAARPLMVLGLILVNTLVFLWMQSLAPSQLDLVLVRYALVPLRYSNPQLARISGLDPSNWWPLLTSAFMHGGWLHLIFNMWFLWIFGPAMEGRFGRLGFAALYVGGAFFASVVHFVTHLQSAEPVLGASGAIAAVIAAYSISYPAARIIMIIPIFFIPLFVPVPAILFAVIWFALQLLQGSSELLSSWRDGGIAWWAHIGGFAFGAMAALIANHMGLGTRTATTMWADRRGRRVPNIGPKERR